MNIQTNGPKGESQKIREGFLQDINSVWRTIEILEKNSKATLGETDPMTETLGFAAVHMMNASIDIGEQISENTNKLSHRSITQLLEVLSIIKWSGPKHSGETREAYQTAVEKISSKYRVDRKTIDDLCVRRLGFIGQGSTDQFRNLVEDWLLKNGTSLSKLIKKHTYKSQYQRIDKFFDNGRIVT